MSLPRFRHFHRALAARAWLALLLALPVFFCACGPQSGGISDGGAGCDARVPRRDLATSTDLAVSALCADYCECMRKECAAVGCYPFSGERDCRDTCATFTAMESYCFPMMCHDSRNTDAVARIHLCEHAWGEYELEECLPLPPDMGGGD